MSSFRIAGVDPGKHPDPAALVMLEKQLQGTGEYGPIDHRVSLVAVRQWPIGTDYYQLAEEILGYNPDAFVIEANGIGEPLLDIVRRLARNKYKGRIHAVVTAASNVRPKQNTDTDNRDGRRLTIPKDQLVFAIENLRRHGTWVECDACGQYLPAEINCSAFVRMRHKVTGDVVERQCTGKGKRRGGGLLIPSQFTDSAKHPLTGDTWKKILEQMRTFDAKLKENGALTFDQGGKGHHGDLVMAMGMAAWWLMKFFHSSVKKELAIVC